MSKKFRIPDGATVLAADGKSGTGNVLLLYGELKPPRVLKVYRTRRSLFREALRSFSQVVLEGKQGSSPAARCATETHMQQAWKGAGLEVIDVLPEPLPEEVTDPALWLEYLPCPDLQTVLNDPSTAPLRRKELLTKLGRETCKREKLALQSRDPFLLHEHATLNHFFVDADRLVAFDMENGYRGGFPVLEALSQELSTMLRSISRLDPETAEVDLSAFLQGYEDKELLKRILDHGIRGTGIRRILKRKFDRKTRPGKSKTDVMENVLQMLNRGGVTT
jgi:hypothetical protein